MLAELARERVRRILSGPSNEEFTQFLWQHMVAYYSVEVVAAYSTYRNKRIAALTAPLGHGLCPLRPHESVGSSEIATAAYDEFCRIASESGRDPNEFLDVLAYVVDNWRLLDFALQDPN